MPSRYTLSCDSLPVIMYMSLCSSFLLIRPIGQRFPQSRIRSLAGLRSWTFSLSRTPPRIFLCCPRMTTELIQRLVGILPKIARNEVSHFALVNLTYTYTIVSVGHDSSWSWNFFLKRLLLWNEIELYNLDALFFKSSSSNGLYIPYLYACLWTVFSQSAP